jgi:hypothetical protein
MIDKVKQCSNNNNNNNRPKQSTTTTTNNNNNNNNGCRYSNSINEKVYVLISV